MDKRVGLFVFFCMVLSVQARVLSLKAREELIRELLNDADPLDKLGKPVCTKEDRPGCAAQLVRNPDMCSRHKEYYMDACRAACGFCDPPPLGPIGPTKQPAPARRCMDFNPLCASEINSAADSPIGRDLCVRPYFTTHCMKSCGVCQ